MFATQACPRLQSCNDPTTSAEIIDFRSPVHSPTIPLNNIPEGSPSSPANFRLMALNVRETTLIDARLFLPDIWEDERGFFKETYTTSKYAALGLADTFVQDSVSFSSKNVIRGLHGDMEMSKLVSVLRGKIWDVIVDVRKESRTYGKWQGFYLSEHNHVQLYIPKGFAHGFIALTDDVVFSYKHGALHSVEREFAYRWNSPALDITWPLVGEPRISAKDKAALLFTP